MTGITNLKSENWILHNSNIYGDNLLAIFLNEWNWPSEE